MIEILKTEREQLNFVVKSKSGRILMQSVAFRNQGEIDKTLKHLTSLSMLLNKVERKTNVDGKFLFYLKNNNNEIIGRSGLYSSEAGMENGIKNLMKSLTS